MQKQQVFKVKGMQRDLSMANTNGEFAYEIVNMRLLPAEENAGLSLTNEKGTLQIEGLSYNGVVIGQCPTNDSLVFFTCDPEGSDYIYELYQEGETWKLDLLFQGELNFSIDNKIEAIFNYETLDIQKVYWIDRDNQLRCMNIVESPTNWGMVNAGSEDNPVWIPGNNVNNQYFDSVKEINSLPSVEIERVSGGSFTAGVLQYYITYFNEFSAESPIIYTSPLLYIAHSNRGANVNDQVSTAFKLTLTNLDTTTWGYIRIYATHRTSLDATPEGSIITEINMPEDGVIEFTDFGSSRTSITPTDLYYVGGKFVKAGTMTVKDQVMFLGNLTIQSSNSIEYTEIKELFDTLRESGAIDNFFSTETRKQKENKLSEYEDTYYHYNNQLNNTEPITHYKYGEKYRFGISVMDKYGVWSNPIWVKDEFIMIPPEQVSETILELPCPSLNLSGTLSDISGIEGTPTLWEYLQSKGAKSIKPLVVFPKEDERKVIAQGVVCPTVYNLKDRKENGPYAQASWFMRPNAPVDLWGIDSDNFGKEGIPLLYSPDSSTAVWTFQHTLSHKSDLINFPSEDGGGVLSESEYIGYYGVASEYPLNNGLTPFDYVYDDFSVSPDVVDTRPNEWKAQALLTWYDSKNRRYCIGTSLPDLSPDDQQKIYDKGSWVEFRHNYALRSKGWSFGYSTPKQQWNDTQYADVTKVNFGMVRAAELDTSMFNITPPTNRFFDSVWVEKVTLNYGTNLSLDNVYFLTTESHKSIRKRVKKGVTCYIDIAYLYSYTPEGSEVTKKVLHVIDRIKIRKAHYNAYAGVNVVVTGLKLDTFSGKFTEPKYGSSAITDDLSEFDGLPKYYVWEAGSTYESDADNKYTRIIISQKYPRITIPLNAREEDRIKYGNLSIADLNVGKSAYYVDNSIITLNSPEIEFKSDSHPSYADSNFRIIGMIPLTATSSDISLEVKDPSIDISSIGTGLIKRTYSNTNIGYHGFKGIVGANAYLTTFNSTQVGGAYSLTPLYPWQSAGTLGYHTNSSDGTSSDFGTKDLLSKKILSNQRFSAATYYFGINTLAFKGSALSNSDTAYLANTNIIGWKPSNGCSIDIFTEDSKESMIKLFNLGYSTPGLVYRGNIEDISTLTKGLTNTPVDNPIYTFMQIGNQETSTNIQDRMNSPAAGSIDHQRFKTGGASIKYKSSPHFVIGFKCFDSLWGSSQKIQEVLPAWYTLNEEGRYSYESNLESDIELEHGFLFEDQKVSSLYHQNYISTDTSSFGLPSKYIPSRYDERAFQNQYSNVISLGKGTFIPTKHLQISSGAFNWYAKSTDTSSILDIRISTSPNSWEISLNDQKLQSTPTEGWGPTPYIVGGNTNTSTTRYSDISFTINFPEAVVNKIMQTWQETSDEEITFESEDNITISYYSSWEEKQVSQCLAEGRLILKSGSLTNRQCTIELEAGGELAIILDNLALLREVETSTVAVPNYGWLWLGEIYRETDPTFGGEEGWNIQLNAWETAGSTGFSNVIITEEYSTENNEIEERETIVQKVQWTIGDTYYQRFDTLKTYAYDDNAKNSIVDITSFMVETRINIDGRYDRNRGQESNLQMSPTNFNLMNDIYSQRDNFFTYRILDDDVQARTKFPSQITWSLSKTAGATVDAWMNITLASVLDLDGAEGELKALKTFNNSIVAFQESGISQILFNSRVQIPTSEMVPIQIANSGKVDGQQFISRDVGCQDKWNIVTTPMGLYFVDYFNKSIYRFNGQLEDLSSSKGFRGWCDKYINSNSSIIGYYDVKNREVMYYDSNFRTDGLSDSVWLGYSELTNTFSSFYTYPEAVLSHIKGKGIWLYEINNKGYMYQHQAGSYNDLLGTKKPYGLTVVTRQDSNMVKTFTNVEFRADTYIGTNSQPEIGDTFNTLSIWTEDDNPKSSRLEYNKYRPSNLKKMLRTWRANIPRPLIRNNISGRFVNQWAKIGLWKKIDTSKSMPGTLNNEKTILHDLAVIYSE